MSNPWCATPAGTSRRTRSKGPRTASASAASSALTVVSRSDGDDVHGRRPRDATPAGGEAGRDVDDVSLLDGVDPPCCVVRRVEVVLRSVLDRTSIALDLDAPSGAARDDAALLRRA